MQRLLIILGLVIIPFYEIIFRIFPFAIIQAPDSRIPKEEIALVFALAIGLLAVFEGEIKPFRNKFLLIIPVYLLINLIMAPHAPLVINNNEVGDFYFWKPFAEVLCFSLMIIAIASASINFDKILKVMVICGTVMAFYVILQKFGFDQFWQTKGYNFDGAGGAFTNVRSEALGGNLGQPTILASWLVMMVPLAIYFKKWWQVVLMITACLLTQGAMVSIALVVIGTLYLIRIKKWLLILIIPLIIISGIFIFKNPSKVIERMDGRYQVWSEIFSDLKNGQTIDNKKFPITGIGLGRFSFIFPIKHQSQFNQAHNDILEFIYNCGFIGGLLIIGGLFIMVSHIQWNFLNFSIFLSFLTVFICGLGSFPFQLGAHQFYSALLVGILNNESIRRS